MGVGRGYGKLLLFGEHAAVYGHPAVGVRLDRFIEIEVEPGAADWAMPGLDSDATDLIGQALERLPAITGLPVSPGTLRLRGDLPMSVGFGSSAAFCTALVRALAPPEFAASVQSLWSAAHELERVFHGTPSGIDTGLSVYPGASTLYPAPPGLPRREAVVLPAAALVVGSLPRTAATAVLVARVRSARERDRAGVDGRLGALGEIARAVSDPVHCPDAGALGRFADRAQTILASLELSTPDLDRTLDALRAYGATGAKLSGAGGGGAFYGVFDDEARARDAAQRLGRTGPEVGGMAPFVLRL